MTECQHDCEWVTEGLSLPPEISFFLLSLGGRGSSRGIVAAVQGHGPPKMRVSVGVILCGFFFGSGC